MITNGMLIVVLTVYAESQGEPFEGKVAVAQVIANRARISGRSMAEECLRPRQFSCWNGGLKSPAMEILKKKADLWAWRDCSCALNRILSEAHKDPHPFTHYYNPKLVTPAWSLGVKKTVIGNHVFVTLPMRRKRG